MVGRCLLQQQLWSWPGMRREEEVEEVEEVEEEVEEGVGRRRWRRWMILPAAL